MFRIYDIELFNIFRAYCHVIDEGLKMVSMIPSMVKAVTDVFELSIFNKLLLSEKLIP